jgi:N-acylglucosamine 2-epimerase
MESEVGSLTRARMDALIAAYRDGLLTDTLPFWLEHGWDRELGGIIGSLNRDGTIIDTDKSVWQQGRFAWVLGELYNHVEPREEWLAAARSVVSFMDRHCFDVSDGRMWFQVTREGQPIRKRRYAFSESFAAIAYGELARATGESAYAEKARRTFQRFVEHNLDPKGVQPKFTETRPQRGIAFPMITLVTAQELRDSIGLTEATSWIDQSIETIRRDFMKHELRCVMETVGPHGEILDHFDGRTLNPGHAIEAAWFVMREGKLRNDTQLVHMGCTMLDWMWERGWDPEFGGLLYFVDVRGLPVQEYWHDMKFWWPHNEGIIASLLAYQLTGDPKYAQWHTLIHDWVYQRFPDPEYGEWYGYLHRDGRISVPLKGNLWKGPFHLPRMQLVCWKLLEEIGT